MRTLLLAIWCALPVMAQRIDLADGWTLQSSAGGREYSTRVPSTVVAALVANKVYPDPYFGMNLRSYPGMGYDIGRMFANLPTPADSPFAVPWRYRNEFRLPPATKGKRVWLNFESLNYRANIQVNGKPVASREETPGMYRTFEFDVTDKITDGVNRLEVEIFPPKPNDLTITFVDWNPMPPDKDMGVTGEVFLRLSGPVAVRNPQVRTSLSPSHDRAELSASADLRNGADAPVEGTLKAELGGRVVSKRVTLAAHAMERVDLAAVAIANPKLWWPYQFGPQNLERARFTFETAGAVSDRQEVEFGIREVTSELDAQKRRSFRINGQRILIRGGGWTQDMLLRRDPAREDDELRYVRDMNLNTVRLEGKLMDDRFFQAADHMGILVMPGWCCCSFWERWKDWTPDDYRTAGESMRDQARRLRNHPSIFVWLYGSDESPNAQAENVYRKVLEEERWPVPSVSSAADRTTTVTGITGVKMTGPYDYVAPGYWLEDHKHGGAFGFNTETSPGPAIPELASIKEMLPPEHLWPIDEFWNFHAGSGSYRNVNLFTTALEARYGKAKDLEDYVRKSQVMTYEGERAMFEAYGRNKYASTGVIQWMLNNSWPSIIWHLYDWYLRPGGGYFGTKKACEPLHVQYSYDDRSVAVVNSYHRDFPGHSVTARVYNLDLTEKFSRTAPVEITADVVARPFAIPEIDGLSDVYFVRLSLKDAAGKIVSENFYCLPTRLDDFEWDKSNGRYTPIRTYANLTALEGLPRTTLKIRSKTEVRGADQVEHVTIANTGKALAFFVHLSVEANGRDLAPVIWSDNYVSLMPGEQREITATVHRNQLGGATPVVRVSGWNAAPE
jgi:exo-1,4-beta-D-glucosaminidase